MKHKPNLNKRKITPAQQSRAEDQKKKRQDIINCAAKVFKNDGYDGASLDDIAKMMNMERASLYYYFKGKKEIFQEMIGIATAGNVEAAEKIAASGKPPA